MPGRVPDVTPVKTFIRAQTAAVPGTADRIASCVTLISTLGEEHKAILCRILVLISNFLKDYNHFRPQILKAQSLSLNWFLQYKGQWYSGTDLVRFTLSCVLISNITIFSFDFFPLVWEYMLPLLFINIYLVNRVHCSCWQQRVPLGCILKV